MTEGTIGKAHVNLAEKVILNELDYDFHELLMPRNIAAVVAVVTSAYNRTVSWLDVKILIWKSQARGRVSQQAVSHRCQPRLELSGRRHCLQRLANSDVQVRV